MTPPKLEPRRFIRTFEELRHVAAVPGDFDPGDADPATEAFCTRQMIYRRRVSFLFEAMRQAAGIEYAASLTTRN